MCVLNAHVAHPKKGGMRAAYCAYRGAWKVQCAWERAYIKHDCGTALLRLHSSEMHERCLNQA
jgi:hypothetical protein